MALEGTLIGSIRLTHRVGAGGMGEVYAGIDTVLERKVAVKVLKAEMIQHQNAQERFFREGKTLSKLNHSNICKVFDFRFENGRAYLILEWVNGETLRETIEGSITESSKRNIARQILLGLQAAHEKNVIHRDLKPENIMIDEKGTVKILDFGLARILEDPEEPTIELTGKLSDMDPESFSLSNPRLTRHSSVLGTPRYMSPEQARNENLTTSCDLYSLGLILQELFTGKSPIEDNMTPLVMMYKAIEGESLPPKGLDRDLAQLINDLKSYAPGMRPNAPATLQRLEDIWNKPKRLRKRIAIGIVGLLLMVSSLVSTYGFYRARKSEAKALAALEKTEAVNDFLKDMMTSIDPFESGDKDVKVIDMLSQSGEKAEKAFENHPKSLAAVNQTLGIAFRRLGEYEKAEVYLTRALELFTDAEGENHYDTLNTGLELGELYDDQGKLEESRKQLETIVKQSEAAFGPRGDLTLISRAALALTLDELGKYQEAEAIDRDVKKIYETLSMTDSEEYLKLINNLALALDHQGRYEEAEPFYLQAVEEGQARYGKNHPNTISYANNLASNYERLGKYEKAEVIHRNNIKLIRDVLGENHRFMFSTLNNLALSLYRQGKVEECEEIFKEVYEKGRQTFGEQHPSVLIWMSNYGRLLMKQGKYKKSKPILEENLQIRLKYLGPDHPDTADSYESLGELYRLMGNDNGALANFNKAYDIRKQVLGAENPDTISLAFNMGELYQKIGNRKKALQWYTDAKDNALKAWGGEHEKYQKILDAIKTLNP